RIPAGVQPQIVAETGGFHYQGVAFPMAGRVPVPSRIRILRKRPSIGEDLAVLHIALREDDHAARELENSLVIIVGPDSWSSARHAMNVRIESLLDPAYLDQVSSPRPVRQGILQRRG